MRIAILAHLHHPIAEPFLGGTEMHTAIVADELIRRGHDVTLYAKQGSVTSARLVPVLDEDFVFGQMPGPDGQDRSEQILAAAVTRAIGTIRAGSYDVVFNNSLGPLPYTMLSDRPMLTVLHTPPLVRVNAVIQHPGWRPGRRHAFVAVSEFNTESWRTVLPQATCIPNGIYLDQWADAGRSEDDLAVWSGRITPEKGLHVAIAAVREAGMRLEFGGPIAEPGYFETEIRPLLDDDVVHRGHVDHRGLAELLSRGSVFVASALWAEPFGLAMVEAMACGTPVAALPNGAAAEVVDTYGGTVARDCSVEALTEAVKLARDADRALVRTNAQRYDAQLMVDRYVHTLERLVQA
jgi:glycosyltransferase involved in cell wall biosynthesis